MANDKNLHFESYEEAGNWFDSHDMTDYEEQLIPVDIDFETIGSHDWVELDREIGGCL